MLEQSADDEPGARTMIPQTYEQWWHCITVDCGIEMTPEYLSRRLAILSDRDSQETRRFRDLYGDHHWKTVTGWFERAARELAD